MMYMYTRNPIIIDRLGNCDILSVVANREAKCKLGESPIWCHATNKLFWIDILGKLLFCLDYTQQVNYITLRMNDWGCFYCKLTQLHSSKVLERWDLSQLCPHLGRPCCLALCKSSRLLVAFETQFAFFDPVSHDLAVAELVVSGGGEWDQVLLRRDGFNVRLNDGRVDPRGNLVIGGINESWGDFGDGWKRVQPCYYVEFMPPSCGSPRLSVSVISHIPLAKVSNSICFSPDGSSMYYTDSPSNRICVFPHMCSGDSEGDREGEVVILTEHQPDGSIVDARYKFSSSV